MFCFLFSLPNRRTGPREGEIQIDCRRNGYHFRRIGWLLKNTTHAKEKETHQRFFINYIPAHLPSDVLFSYTARHKNNSIEQPHTLQHNTHKRHETHVVLIDWPNVFFRFSPPATYLQLFFL